MITDAVPCISVVMSAYNGEDYIRVAIQSVVDQVFSDFEFIIVNDGSTDHTANIIEEFDDRRIILVNNPVNRGLIYSLNLGFSLARGRYIARMDADDISLPNRLEKQVAFFEMHPEVGVLGTAIKVVSSFWGLSKTVKYPESDNCIRWCFTSYPALAHPTVIIRHSILDNMDLYDKSYVHIEDYDLWVRMSKHCKVANLPETLLIYRSHPESVTSKNFQEQKRTGNFIRKRVFSDILSDILNEEVDMRLIETLSNKEAHQHDDIVEALNLLLKSYRLFVQNNHLNGREVAFVKNQVSKRLAAFLGRGYAEREIIALLIANKMLSIQLIGWVFSTPIRRVENYLLGIH